jgi:hypothetical protein
MDKMAPSIRGLYAVAAFVLLSACTGASRGVSPSPSSASSVVSTSTPSPTGLFVRTCEASVYGDLGRGWRKNAFVAGAIAFVGLPGAATAPRSDFAPLEDGFRSVKALAVVNEGADVTISVSSEDQTHVSLLYDPASFKDLNSYQIADGETVVTFQSCSSGESPFGVRGPTQFNGGFIVDGPQCATLEVRAATGPAKRVDVAFGRGTCASSS